MDYSCTEKKFISPCYESPKKKKVFHAFEYLIQNPKAYNGVRI